jgi:hypothetical protein
MTLDQVAGELAARLSKIFLPREDGSRPCHGRDPRYAIDPHFRDLVLFNEYFHGDDGRGIGASHQTGWTALVIGCLEGVAQRRLGAEPSVPSSGHGRTLRPRRPEVPGSPEDTPST